jgi:hypothetical protein
LKDERYLKIELQVKFGLRRDKLISLLLYLNELHLKFSLKCPLTEEKICADSWTDYHRAVVSKVWGISPGGRGCGIF